MVAVVLQALHHFVPVPWDFGKVLLHFLADLFGGSDVVGLKGASQVGEVNVEAGSVGLGDHAWAFLRFWGDFKGGSPSVGGDTDAFNV